jgi:demethylmenaquinone methyltransferase/2-methoxy-6-polyprenyl-1,4-benzoquinol methylase
MSKEVKDMFASIAPKYDTANSILSLGIHHVWRNKTVELSGAKTGSRVLDCATGTGDLALAFKKTVGDSGYVLGTDFCTEMMETAPAKSAKKQLHVDFEVADAMNLQYDDKSFDIASISFGIRNVDNPIIALSEMARVVKSGGTIVVLEFGQPNGLFGSFYSWYSKYIIPYIGGILTGNADAYRYLPKTAAIFPCREEFTDLMLKTGYIESATFYSLTFGIAFLYIGKVK